ncbi:TPA: hypothetical protein ACU21S_000907 [Mannheimia haemolytica]
MAEEINEENKIKEPPNLATKSIILSLTSVINTAKSPLTPLC